MERVRQREGTRQGMQSRGASLERQREETRQGMQSRGASMERQREETRQGMQSRGASMERQREGTRQGKYSEGALGHLFIILNMGSQRPSLQPCHPDAAQPIAPLAIQCTNWTPLTQAQARAVHLEMAFILSQEPPLTYSFAALPSANRLQDCVRACVHAYVRVCSTTGAHRSPPAACKTVCAHVSMCAALLARTGAHLPPTRLCARMYACMCACVQHCWRAQEPTCRLQDCVRACEHAHVHVCSTAGAHRSPPGSQLAPQPEQHPLLLP